MVRAALRGDLANVAFTPDPIFRVHVPESCPGVPAEVLHPRHTWKNPADYEAQARKLAGLFRANFANYAAQTTEAVRDAGPRP